MKKMNDGWKNTRLKSYAFPRSDLRGLASRLSAKYFRFKSAYNQFFFTRTNSFSKYLVGYDVRMVLFRVNMNLYIFQNNQFSLCPPATSRKSTSYYTTA